MHFKVKVVVGIVEERFLGIKCSKYWPREQRKMVVGELSIDVLDANVNPLFEYKRLKLSKGKQSAEVEHFYLYQWEDRQYPDPVTMNEYMSLLEVLSKKHTPMVYHCSAGIGRSGTILSSLLLYKHFKYSKEKKKTFRFSIFELIRNLREQRFAII